MRMRFREVHEVKETKIEKKLPIFMRITEEERERNRRRMEAANQWFIENYPNYSGEPEDVPITVWQKIPQSVFEGI
jgi:phosphoenolpyruvate synthase/pyruvate phosphate dikinase